MAVDVKKLEQEMAQAAFDLDIETYNRLFTEVVEAYNQGTGPAVLPADVGVARSLIAPGTGALRDFSYIAPEIPRYLHEKCVGCMTCVTECPDTAILAKVTPESEVERRLAALSEEERALIEPHFARTKKYYDQAKKRGVEPGLFSIFIDPTKCKGCAECVEVCHELGYDALEMIPKEETTIPEYKKAFEFFVKLPDTPDEYIHERALADIMLKERSLLYVGGAGSCMGCGEATALRMLTAAMGFRYGAENFAIIASTGCNTVYGSTYPYNPYRVPWSNSLFENGPTFAMGVRARWDQMGWKDKVLWVVGGDGAMYDIGFQALSRMAASGMNINVLVLDTQVYSNTGGQASTASFPGQDAKMSAIGKAIRGKVEHRKELGRIMMMHPQTYVAQTTAAHINHFYKAVLGAAEYEGPSIVIVYTTCQPEHGVADHLSAYRAKMAVNTRAFPLFIYDPRKGSTIQERLDLKGNPAVTEDWYRNPKTGEVLDFIAFAREEGRFAKNFDAEGNPDPMLIWANEDRLQNWRLLQEMAGVKRNGK